MDPDLTPRLTVFENLVKDMKKDKTELSLTHKVIVDNSKQKLKSSTNGSLILRNLGIWKANIWKANLNLFSIKMVTNLGFGPNH